LAAAVAAAAAAAVASRFPGGGVIDVVGWRASMIMHLAGAATWFYLAGGHSRLAAAENCLQQRWVLSVFEVAGALRGRCFPAGPGDLSVLVVVALVVHEVEERSGCNSAF
jgi:hypothetical protein